LDGKHFAPIGNGIWGQRLREALLQLSISDGEVREGLAQDDAAGHAALFGPPHFLEGGRLADDRRGSKHSKPLENCSGSVVQSYSSPCLQASAPFEHCHMFHPRSPQTRCARTDSPVRGRGSATPPRSEHT